MLIYIFCFLGTLLGSIFVGDFHDSLLFMGLAIIFFTIFSKENNKLIKDIGLSRSFLFFVVGFIVTVSFTLLFKQIEIDFLKYIVIALLLIGMRYLWGLLCTKLAHNN